MTGTPITFTVEATGDDLQFLWQKDDKDIDKNESRLQCSQTDNTSTLHIEHVKKSDQGHYKCLVKNPVEKSETKSDVAELIVREFYLFGIIMCGTDHKTSSMCLYLHISCTHRSQLEENIYYRHTCVAGVACN